MALNFFSTKTWKSSLIIKVDKSSVSTTSAATTTTIITIIAIVIVIIVAMTASIVTSSTAATAATTTTTTSAWNTTSRSFGKSWLDFQIIFGLRLLIFETIRLFLNELNVSTTNK